MERLTIVHGLYPKKLFGAARYLIDLARDFEPDADSINIMETNLLTLLSAMDDNCDSMESLLYSTEGLHRMTVPFNHARKRLACNLRSYLSKHKSSREVVREAVKEVASLRCAAKEPSGSLAVLQ